jgi:predicted RecB family nuclease
VVGLSALLDAAHRVDDGLLPEPGQSFGLFARLLADKGLAHENDCLADYRRQPKSILEVPARKHQERFSAWVARIGNPLDGNWDVVYQIPFVHDGVRGIADFLVRVTDPDTGIVCYEPVDAKLARKDAKPGHVLQLCFYAKAIEALTGMRPQWMHLWLGSGRMEDLRIDDFSPYWRRLRGQLAVALAAGPESGTVPELCPHCEFCEFNAVCEQQWRDEDSLIYVAGIRRPERAVLVEGGVTTLAGLACVRPAAP